MNYEAPINVDGYAIHAYGPGIESPECLPPDEPCVFEDKQDPDPDKGYPGKDHGFLNYKEQIDFDQYANDGIITQEQAAIFNSKPVFIAELSTFTGGMDPHEFETPIIPANNYPDPGDPDPIGKVKWIVQAVEVIKNDPRVHGVLWFVGATNGTHRTNWRYFALTEDYNRLPCARADFQSITLGNPKFECNAEAKAPDLKGSLIWENGSPVGIALTGYDGQSGIDYLTTVASPAQTFDLSWTEPGVWYAKTIDWVPPEKETATFSLFDRAGNMSQIKIYNPGQQQGGGGGSGSGSGSGGGGGSGAGPGGDHPDENESDATPLVPSGTFIAAPNGSQTTPRVAILNRSFAPDLWQLLFQLGEPTVLLETNFDPIATAGQYPLLFIPSGGLYGMENSLIFKQRLELYAAAGGTVVTFAQQHGYEFNVLPGAGQPTSVLGAIAGTGEEQPLSGYGWAEDNSCYAASLFLTTEHPILSGFDDGYLTTNVDGYFATSPANAQTLLTRTQNGMPGVLMYPWPADGSGGQIIVTSIYDDWGAARGQITEDTRTLLRNLISWALAPTTLAEYRPDDAISISIPVSNETERDATTIRFSLINPTRNIVENRDAAIPLIAGDDTIVVFDTIAATPLGIWRIDTTLLNERGQSIGPRLPVAYFTVADPPETLPTVGDIRLNITAETDRFAIDDQGTFTFHVYNNSAAEKSVTVRYGLPHHTWEKGTDPNSGQSYGLFYNLNRTLTVPANSEVTFEYTPTIYTTDRLWARAEAEGQVRAYAHYAIFPSYFNVVKFSNIQSDAPEYARNSPVQISAVINNPNGSNNQRVFMTVIDAEGVQLHQDMITLPPIAANTPTPFTFAPFTIPATANSGVAKVTLALPYAPLLPHQDHTAFRISASPLVLSQVGFVG